jgi:flagellar basal body-associated protein FliL
MVFSFGILYHYREILEFPEISWEKIMPTDSRKTTVNCTITSRMGRRGALKAEVKIPCKDKKQKEKLSRMKKQIQSDFLMTVDQMALQGWIKERNYEAIRKEMLRVINRHTDEPIKNIYFDSLLYQ